MKKTNYKFILKNLNQAPTDKVFLNNFRQELNTFVIARPIAQPGFFALFTKTATVLGLLTLALLGGTGLVYASKGSLPGQLLYPVKISTEKARLAITTEPTKRQELQVEFINKRIAEVAVISKENNFHNNAFKALQVVEEKITEIEEEEKQSAETEITAIENTPTTETENDNQDKIQESDSATTTTNTIKTSKQTAKQVVSSSTGKPKNVNVIQNKKDKSTTTKFKKDPSNAYEKSKLKLRESYSILEKLISSSSKEKKLNNEQTKEFLRARRATSTISNTEEQKKDTAKTIENPSNNPTSNTNTTIQQKTEKRQQELRRQRQLDTERRRIDAQKDENR